MTISVQSLGRALEMVCGPINDVLVIESVPSDAYSHLCSILMSLAIIKTPGLWYSVILKITHYRISAGRT